MKKAIKLFSILALLLCVVSCQISGVDDGLLSPLTVTAVIDGTDATRVNYTVDNETAFTVTPTWSVGDKVIGFDDEGNKFTFTVETVEDGIAAMSTGGYTPTSITGNTHLHAVYAPGYTADDIVAGELSVDLATQDGALNNNSRVLMYSTADLTAGVVCFHFEKATAIVGLRKFQLPVSFTTAVTKVTLNGVATSGTFRLDNGGLTFVPSTTVGAVTATRTLVTNSSGICNTPVYFSVVPTKDAQLSLDADTPSKSYVNFQPIDKMDIEAGYYYHMSKIFYGPEAEVNGVGYGSVVEAFDAANEIDDPVVIKLLSNCQATEPIVLCNVRSAGYTLDLNGKTLTATAKNTITLSLCTLTITDNSTDNPAAYGTVTSSSAQIDSVYVIYVQDEAQLKMAKGRITAPNYRCICFKSGGSGVLSGNAEVSSPNGYAIYLTDTGGTLDIMDDVRISGKGNVVYYGTGSSLITGGIISNTASGAIVYVNGDAELTVGGNCRINTSYASNRNPVFANGSAKAYVTGGCYGMPVYNAVTHDAEGNYYVNVVNNDPATAADYPYTVVQAPGNAVEISTVSSTYQWDFATPADAFYHGDKRSTQFEATSVVLHNDLSFSEPLSLPSAHSKGLLLDLNGHRLVSTASPAVSTGGSLTIEDAVGAGELVTSGDIAVSAGAGEITVNGATLTGAVTALEATGSARVVINSGWFAGGTGDMTKSGSAKIESYGGKFKNSPVALLAEGCEAREISEVHNGITYNYQVVGGVAAATVNGEDCPSFANALSKALAYNGAEDTVVLCLMKDVKDYDKMLDLTNKSGKPFVLDLNGHTLGVVIDSCMTTTGSLTITDRSGTRTGKYTSSKRKQLFIFRTGKVLVQDCIIECTRGGYMSTGATYTMIHMSGGSTSTPNTEGMTFKNCKIYSNSYLKPIYAAYGNLTIEDCELSCGTASTGGYYIVDVYTGGNVIIRNSSFVTFDRKSNGDKYGCVHTRTGNVDAGSNIELYDCWFYSGKGLSVAADHPEYSKVFKISNCYSNVDFRQYLPQATYAAGTSLQPIDPPAKHTHMGVEYEYGFQVK